MTTPKFLLGSLVKAVKLITEYGDPSKANPKAKYPDPHYIHANIGDLGLVIRIDSDQDNRPVVRFRETKTAALCFLDEIELVLPPAKPKK